MYAKTCKVSRTNKQRNIEQTNKAALTEHYETKNYYRYH